MNCKNCGKELEFQGELCEECEAALAENANTTVAVVKTPEEEKTYGVKKGVWALILAILGFLIVGTAWAISTSWEDKIYPLVQDMITQISQETGEDMYSYITNVVYIACVLCQAFGLLFCFISFILSIASMVSFGKSTKTSQPRPALMVLAIISLLLCAACVFFTFQSVNLLLAFNA